LNYTPQPFDAAAAGCFIGLDRSLASQHAPTAGIDRRKRI